MLKTLFRTRNVTDYDTTDLETVGTERVEQTSEGLKHYLWVYNASGSALAIGNAVYHAFTDGAAFLTKVYDAATARLGALAGIALSAIPSASYGWIQTFGYNSNISMSGTTIISGDSLVGTDGNTYLSYGTAMGTAAAYRRHVMALASVTNGLAATAGFIHCL
jgi:hypothetical protein